MELSSRRRWVIYFIGVAIGCVISAIILGQRGLPHPGQTPEPGVIRREVPGVIGELMADGRPLEGDFVISTDDGTPAADGSRLRAVVVPGLDPGAFIRVEEQCTPPNSGGRFAVTAWKFMFADRVRVKLAPQADRKALGDALHAHGWRFLELEPGTDWIAIQLDAHHAFTVPKAVTEIQAWTQWVSAVEPDFLPAPTGKLHAD
jgi:hypothetical protein